MSWLQKLKIGMAKTTRLFSFSKMDLSHIDDVEDALLQADVGIKTTDELINSIKKNHCTTESEIKDLFYKKIIEKITPIAQPLHIDTSKKPFIILMTGVNGAGKTTTIGKMGQYYKNQGKKVAFVAGDTFRAGAVAQLEKWGNPLGKVFTTTPNGDAAGLIYDALKATQYDDTDIIFIDTAGRLHNRLDLMDELKKIVRVIKKIDPTGPHATLLVLDATIGQNALVQIKAFLEMIGITGLIMTKLDGTAKGGILLSLADSVKLPVHAIGVGEKADDLHPFTPHQYATSLLGLDDDDI